MCASIFILQAMQYLKELETDRGGKCKTETLDEDADPLDVRFNPFANTPL